MFKVHVRISDDTDIALEVQNLAEQARKHGLDEIRSFALTQSAESILTELKRQRDETAPYGIQLALSKSLKTDDYEILFDLSPAPKTPKNKNVFSKIFGK